MRFSSLGDATIKSGEDPGKGDKLMPPGESGLCPGGLRCQVPER